MYLFASVLDPVYGFVWVEDDYPGTRDVKDALRSRITDAILQQATVFDASISRNAVNNTAAAAAAAPETDGGTSSTIVPAQQQTQSTRNDGQCCLHHMKNGVSLMINQCHPQVHPSQL